MMLVRYRCPGRGEQEVHLVPLHRNDDEPGAVGGLCGTRLGLDGIETVTPGAGLRCTNCFVVHVIGSPAAGPAPARSSGIAAAPTMTERLAAGLAYRRLGWPVTQRRDRVTLNLDLDVDAVALVLPTVLATEVTEILLRRRCPPPVLAHPALPAHRVILTGHPFPVPLTWPIGVHRVTGTLLLPPSVTASGPVCWARAPLPDALRSCREMDVLAAIRTALMPPRDHQGNTMFA